MIRPASTKTHILILVFALAGALGLSADTVRLKNGRVYKGAVTRFSHGEFMVLLAPVDTRSGQQERLIFLVEDVESIEFDSAAPTVSTNPSEKLVVVDASKEVIPTGLQVRRGDKIRITASGEMQFSDGRVTTPKGLDTRESWPFPGERFGVLIAMVGDPQSTIYHVVGDSGEFEARRDGELFLQVNARSLQGVRGAYTARIQAHTATAATAAAVTTPVAEPSRPRSQQVAVPADEQWTDTGIDIQPGDTLRLTADGTIYYTSSKTCGPNGTERDWKDLVRALPVNDVGRGALIGLIGQKGVAKPFFIGEKGEFTVEAAGRLFLSINDDNYDNNRGSFRVQVEVVPKR